MKYIRSYVVVGMWIARSFVGTFIGIFITSCGAEQEITINSHKLTWGNSANTVGVMIDASSDKAIELIDFADNNVFDVVKIIDHANHKMTMVFEQGKETVVMVIDMSNKDDMKWTARLLIDGTVSTCYRGAARQWYFINENGEKQYVHLADVKEGYAIDSKDTKR